jgi:hypothetical protein
VYIAACIHPKSKGYFGKLVTKCMKFKEGFGNPMTKLSKSKDNFENLKIEIVIRFEWVWLFWFVFMIKGMVNLMAMTQVMENDDWIEAQIISKSIVLHIECIFRI